MRKTLVDQRPNKPFRSEPLNEYFEILSRDSDIYKSGVNEGIVYFIYLDGRSRNYTLSQFARKFFDEILATEEMQGKPSRICDFPTIDQCVEYLVSIGCEWDNDKEQLLKQNCSYMHKSILVIYNPNGVSVLVP